MAERTDNKDEQDQQPKKKGLPLKTLLVLVAFLVIEAATVVAVIAITKPADVQAEDTVLDEAARQEEAVEELVVDDKFVNVISGETLIYNTEIYVVVRFKHQAKVQEKAESMKARITTDVANIIKRAPPAHFAEPTHATLARQIKAALDERFGTDPVDNKQIVQEVLIKKMIPFKADY